MLRPAIFFDRDGTLNEEVGYAGRAEQFHLLPMAPAAVRRVNEAGWAAVVITNQAGVARGFYSEADVAALHRLMGERLGAGGAHLDGIYYCPHHPRGSVAGYSGPCSCRKPEPGMLRQAERELGLDIEASWVIGDRLHDIACAHTVGARGVLVRTGFGERALAGTIEDVVHDVVPDHVAADVAAAVEWIFAAVTAPTR
jgi:D-glycero-D-manno-heptose 1,7-bisphosphate phosphatase